MMGRMDSTKRVRKKHKKTTEKSARQTKKSTDETWLEQHSRATEAFGSSNNTEYLIVERATSDSTTWAYTSLRVSISRFLIICWVRLGRNKSPAHRRRTASSVLMFPSRSSLVSSCEMHVDLPANPAQAIMLFRLRFVGLGWNEFPSAWRHTKVRETVLRLVQDAST